MGHNSVVSGHSKSIGIPQVDWLSTGPLGFGASLYPFLFAKILICYQIYCNNFFLLPNLLIFPYLEYNIRQIWYSYLLPYNFITILVFPLFISLCFLTMKAGLLCGLLLSLIIFIYINSLICILKSPISSCEYIIGLTLITLSGSIISNLQ